MSTNSSSLKRLRPKLQLKVPINTTFMDQCSKRKWKMDSIRKTITQRQQKKRSEKTARHRRNPQSRPARYVNGVGLSDDEVGNITWHTMSVSTKKRPKVRMVRNLESSSSSFARRTLSAQAKVREEVWSRTSWWIVDPELRDGFSDVKENYLEK